MASPLQKLELPQSKRFSLVKKADKSPSTSLSKSVQEIDESPSAMEPSSQENIVHTPDMLHILSKYYSTDSATGEGASPDELLSAFNLSEEGMRDRYSDFFDSAASTPDLQPQYPFNYAERKLHASCYKSVTEDERGNNFSPWLTQNGVSLDHSHRLDPTSLDGLEQISKLREEFCLPLHKEQEQEPQPQPKPQPQPQPQQHQHQHQHGQQQQQQQQQLEPPSSLGSVPSLTEEEKNPAAKHLSKENFWYGKSSTHHHHHHAEGKGGGGLSLKYLRPQRIEESPLKRTVKALNTSRESSISPENKVIKDLAWKNTITKPAKGDDSRIISSGIVSLNTNHHREASLESVRGKKIQYSMHSLKPTEIVPNRLCKSTKKASSQSILRNLDPPFVTSVLVGKGSTCRKLSNPLHNTKSTLALKVGTNQRLHSSGNSPFHHLYNVNVIGLGICENSSSEVLANGKSLLSSSDQGDDRIESSVGSCSSDANRHHHHHQESEVETSMGRSSGGFHAALKEFGREIEQLAENKLQEEEESDSSFIGDQLPNCGSSKEMLLSTSLEVSSESVCSDDDEDGDEEALVVGTKEMMGSSEFGKYKAPNGNGTLHRERVGRSNSNRQFNESTKKEIDSLEEDHVDAKDSDKSQGLSIESSSSSLDATLSVYTNPLWTEELIPSPNQAKSYLNQPLSKNKVGEFVLLKECQDSHEKSIHNLNCDQSFVQDDIIKANNRTQAPQELVESLKYDGLEVESRKFQQEKRKHSNFLQCLVRAMKRMWLGLRKRKRSEKERKLTIWRFLLLLKRDRRRK